MKRVVLNRLKVHIAVQLIFLLGTAMFLVNLVLMMLVQKSLLKSETARGELFLSSLEYRLNEEREVDRLFETENFKAQTASFLSASGFSALLILNEDRESLFFQSAKGVPKKEMAAATRQAVRTGRKIHQDYGDTRGVFRVKPQYLVIASPWIKEGRIAGGLCTLLPLRGLYEQLRSFQQILAVYILINTLVFALIGLYRLSRITVKPLHSLLDRAEGYQGEGDLFSLDEKRENEFTQLSRALNQMLYRISAGKEALRDTVRSLEKANRELKKAQHDIINAEKLASVGRLSAGIAHEIGNPVAIISGYLDLLKQGDIGEAEKREFIHRTEAEINRISRIIRQLLHFAKPSDGNLEPVSVHRVIREILEVFQYQPFLSKTALKLSLNAASDTVRANPGQLQQAFLNLIINAADAVNAMDATSGGRLCIITENGSDHLNSEGNPLLKIEFIDNGPGISSEHMASIFDPFFTTKEPGRGTGLGLSVCFMIVEAIGGKIKAVSKEGEGTSMILHLPLFTGDTHSYE